MPWNKDGTRKKSAFYLRSGNTTPFKEMGSYGPDETLLGVSGKLSETESDSANLQAQALIEKLAQDKKDKENKEDKEDMGSPMKDKIPQNFNMKGDPSKTPGWKPKINSNSWLTEHGKKLVKDAKTVKSSSKGYDISKDKINQALNKAAGGHSESDRISKKAIREAAERQAKSKVKKGAAKTGLKIAGKVASKLAGPVGVATTIYEVGKFAKDWIQTGDVEKAWDKNKWWGSEKGNLFKKDDK